MYADDTVIYGGDKDVNKIEQCLNEDLGNRSNLSTIVKTN